MKILITGGAGFIGSCLVRHIIKNTNDEVVNVDKLTYAGNLESLESIRDNNRYFFEQIDICDSFKLNRIFETHKPDAVMHLAAESHVDRSIENSFDFINTNIVGTYNLLEVSRNYWSNFHDSNQKTFKFHHISTDEVYGDLEDENDKFTEENPYLPSSPYSASKAASDHLVRAWNRTYKLPTIISNCSNNYGPYHFPEKLIPVVILNALDGKPLPIYGSGNQIRDWLYVEDHVRALYKIITSGNLGETYNVGGNNEKRNIDVVRSICRILDELAPIPNSSYANQITYVKDRAGHDKRYAIDATKIQKDLGWFPEETFDSGLKKTIVWYLENLDWCRKIKENNKIG